ncbi:MAG: hypothetical protein MJ209_05290 [archaeon]|nr:hypothetical protein [archaeon]
MGVEGDVNLYRQNKYAKYIAKMNDIYRIIKSFDGEPLIFGEYDSLEDALEARDILMENNWDESKIPEYLYSWRHFVSYSPPTDCFEIYNLIEGHFISFGLFDNHEDVKFALNILRNNGWNATEIPFDLYSEYSNIRYYKRGNIESFVIIRRVDGELIQYGTFDTYDEAVSHRNNLILSNWEKEISSEEKYDEYIYLRSDGKYYIKNEVNGVMCIFGVYDDFIEAVTARLEFIKKNWDVEYVPEDEYF